MDYTLNEIMHRSVERDASDIHITSGRPVTFRVNGELEAMDDHKMTPEEIHGLLLPLMKDNPLSAERFLQDGEVDFAASLGKEGRFRINVFRQRGSEAAALRRLPFEIPAPEELGLPASAIRLAELKRGLVLVTGATGTGKSTTLASLISRINQTYSRHIITLEDPIEYIHRHEKSIVNQRELGSDTQSFAAALRAALRQDPDVILVGEMRDLDTISTAITAAETGHLVFSTLHTNTAASTIDRVVDVFPPYQQQQIRTQLAGVLEAVISQQLVPTFDGSSRVAAFEIMLANAAIRNMIRENKVFQIQSQLQTNRRLGMQTMDDSLYDLYLKNRIDAQTCIYYSVDQESMKKRVIE